MQLGGGDPRDLGSRESCKSDPRVCRMALFTGPSTLLDRAVRGTEDSAAYR